MPPKCGEFPVRSAPDGSPAPLWARKRCRLDRPDREMSETAEREDAPSELRGLACGLIVNQPIALVGLMGAGKTTVGRRLAGALKLPFADADEEIERAAGLKVAEIFTRHGEAEFRRGERRVIARLLDGEPHVLATGGGAFIDPQVRALMRAKAVTVWLKAPLDVLMRRVERRDERPLLRTGDPEAVMRKLMDERYPIYAEADVTIESTNNPHGAAVRAVIEALKDRQARTRP
jgi:shikimate kinase